MSNYLVNDTDLTSVANAIRTKGGTSAPLVFPAGFVSAVENIPSGATEPYMEVTFDTTHPSYYKTIKFYGFPVIKKIANGEYYVTSIEFYHTQTVPEIPANAFTSCSALQTLVLPQNYTSIGNEAFYNCRALQNVSLSNSVTSIGMKAFSTCQVLALTNLPTSLQTIGNYAFDGCAKLALTNLPDLITSIGEAAFNSCKAITISLLPSGLTTLGSSAFSGCNNINVNSVPSGITAINAYTFSGCGGITEFTLHSGITSIGQSAFYNCDGLQKLTFTSTTPPTLTASNAFQNLPTTCVIHVPAGTLSAYTSATNYPNPNTYTYVEDSAPSASLSVYYDGLGDSAGDVTITYNNSTVATVNTDGTHNYTVNIASGNMTITGDALYGTFSVYINGTEISPTSEVDSYKTFTFVPVANDTISVDFEYVD